MKTIPMQAMALAAALILGPAAWAQSHGARTQDSHATTSAATRDAHADSSGWQQAGKAEEAPPASKPPRADQATTGSDDFASLDTDHDGRISRAEAGASQDFSGRFKTLDADGDGYVSSAEYHEGLRTTRTPAVSH